MKRTAVLLSVLAVALAARAQTPAPAKNIAPTLVSGGAKLPSELKLDPTKLKAIKIGPPPAVRDALDVAVANVKTEAERLKTAERAFYDAQPPCHERRYSETEMRNAGCVNGEDLSMCMARLWNWCTNPTRERYVSASGRFQRAVEVLDQKARALASYRETP